MSSKRYSTVAILLHWAIAALILVNLFLGWRMGFVKGLEQFNLFQLHKSVGITILLLSVIRLAWRLANPPPPPVEGLRPWEEAASQAVHWGFYVVMIAMPLSGWIVVSTSPLNIPTLLFHTVPWPHFPGLHDLAAGPKAGVNGVSGRAHEVLAWGALALLGLHLGAIVKHRFLDGHSVLYRMLPRLGRDSSRTEHS